MSYLSRLILLLILVSCCGFGPALAADPMKIVYFDNYPPRSWLENGKMKGILVDIINEALQQRLGIPLIHEGYPWARAQALVENGLADAFITVPTEKRRTYTEVSSEPVIQFKLYIATQKNNPRLAELRQITTIDDLEPFQIVDYFGNGFAEERLKDFAVEWLPNIDAVFPFLASGKADLMLISERGIYVMENLGYQNEIIVLPQPLHSLSFHLCIAKNSPFTQLLPKLDRALQQMQAEHRMELILRSYYQ